MTHVMIYILRLVKYIYWIWWRHFINFGGFLIWLTVIHVLRVVLSVKLITKRTQFADIMRGVHFLRICRNGVLRILVVWIFQSRHNQLYSITTYNDGGDYQSVRRRRFFQGTQVHLFIRKRVFQVWITFQTHKIVACGAKSTSSVKSPFF